MSRGVLDDGAHDGVVEHLILENGKMHIQKFQDIDPLLKLNKDELASSSSGWKGDLHKVAEIPMIMIDIWAKELRAKGYPNTNPLAKENKAFFIAKLNSRDWQSVRVKDGNI